MHSTTSYKSSYQPHTPPIQTNITDKNETLPKPKPYDCGDMPYPLKIKEYQELIQLNSDEVRHFLNYQKQLQEYIKHCKPLPPKSD